MSFLSSWVFEICFIYASKLLEMVLFSKKFYRHKMKIPKNEWEHYGNNPFFNFFYEKYFGFSFLDIFKNVHFCLNFFSLTDEILLIFFTSFVMIISITPYPIMYFFNTINFSFFSNLEPFSRFFIDLCYLNFYFYYFI